VSWWAASSRARSGRRRRRPRRDHDHAHRPRSSAAAPDTVCIEIAQFKATIVDLGELEPGTWTVVAAGEALPVTVTID
jgi:hypothetical protein